MSFTRLDVSLEQYEIGLSGAIPDRKDWSEPAMDRGILEFVALFSGIVIDYERSTLTLAWLHGGRTRVKVNPDVMAIQNGWKATALVPAMRRLRGWKPHAQSRSDISAASSASAPTPTERHA